MKRKRRPDPIWARLLLAGLTVAQAVLSVTLLSLRRKAVLTAVQQEETVQLFYQGKKTTETFTAAKDQTR